jgi:hypothetical protein
MHTDKSQAELWEAPKVWCVAQLLLLKVGDEQMSLKFSRKCAVIMDIKVYPFPIIFQHLRPVQFDCRRLLYRSSYIQESSHVTFKLRPVKKVIASKTWPETWPNLDHLNSSKDILLDFICI